MATIAGTRCRHERPHHGDAAGPRRPRGDRAGARPGRPAAARPQAWDQLGTAGRRPVPAAALHAVALAGGAGGGAAGRARRPRGGGRPADQPDHGAPRAAPRPGPAGRRPVRDDHRPPAGARGGPGRGGGPHPRAGRPARHRRHRPRLRRPDGPGRAPRGGSAAPPTAGASWPTWWSTAGAAGRALADWLAGIGARPPAEEREEAGFVYYGRHFRSADGSGRSRWRRCSSTTPVHPVTLPADNGTWSVGLITSSADHRLRALRDPAVWDAALARCPLAAHWGSPDHGPEPITGVDVMAGLEDRHRRLVVDGEPVVTGLVLVGDAWARTNPALGAGTSIGVVHARALQQVLREVDPADADKIVRAFDDVTGAVVEPLYRATRGLRPAPPRRARRRDQRRPVRDRRPGWAMTKALAAAAPGRPGRAAAQRPDRRCCWSPPPSLRRPAPSRPGRGRSARRHRGTRCRGRPARSCWTRSAPEPPVSRARSRRRSWRPRGRPRGRRPAAPRSRRRPGSAP